VWDKWSGNIRFEQGDAVVLMNIHSRQGKVWQGGEETVVADSLAKWLCLTSCRRLFLRTRHR